MKWFTTFLFMSLLSQSVFAGPYRGGNSGGGGEGPGPNADRIRADLLEWIEEGYAKDLQMPEGLTYPEFVDRMKEILQPREVVISFVTTQQERETDDPEQKVQVEGNKKDCRGFQSKKDGRTHILCNLDRYPKDGNEQYRLWVHEYAILVGVEQNVGASSDYFVSRQVLGYLWPEVVYRLGPNKQNSLGSGQFSNVSCDGKESVMIVDQISLEGGKTVVSGSLPEVETENMPLSIDEYYRKYWLAGGDSTSMVKMAGVKFPDGQIKYVWSPDQENELKELGRLAYESEEGVGTLFMRIFSKTEARQKYDQMYAVKQAASYSGSRRLFNESLEQQKSQVRCENIKVTVKRGAAIRLVCSSYGTSGASLKSVLDSANLMGSFYKLNGDDGAWKQRAATGTLNSCDNFSSIH